MTSLLSGSAIDFDPETHTYRVQGEVFPSVTTILSPWNDLSMVDPDVLARAAAFGTNVHQACHLHNQDALDYDALDPALRPYVDGWRAFLEDSGAIILSSELPVAHTKLRYAGTLDSAALIRKRATLVDIKSGSVVPRTVGPQTAAYAQAYPGPRIRDRLVVHLTGDGKYKAIPLRDPRDLTIFTSALNLHHWSASNA